MVRAKVGKLKRNCSESELLGSYSLLRLPKTARTPNDVTSIIHEFDACRLHVSLTGRSGVFLNHAKPLAYRSVRVVCNGKAS